MTPISILRELEGLPLSDRLFVIEKAVESIRTEKGVNPQAAFANLLRITNPTLNQEPSRSLMQSFLQNQILMSSATLK